jgi:hypothetical protein
MQIYSRSVITGNHRQTGRPSDIFLRVPARPVPVFYARFMRCSRDWKRGSARYESKTELFTAVIGEACDDGVGPEINGEYSARARIPEVFRKRPVPQNLDRAYLITIEIGRMLVIFHK